MDVISNTIYRYKKSLNYENIAAMTLGKQRNNPYYKENSRLSPTCLHGPSVDALCMYQIHENPTQNIFHQLSDA